MYRSPRAPRSRRSRGFFTHIDVPIAPRFAVISDINRSPRRGCWGAFGCGVDCLSADQFGLRMSSSCRFSEELFVSWISTRALDLFNPFSTVNLNVIRGRAPSGAFTWLLFAGSARCVIKVMYLRPDSSLPWIYEKLPIYCSLLSAALSTLAL